MKIQTFNDGVASFYKVGNIAEKGERPKDGLIEIAKKIRYEERTVGVGRFWTAMQSSAKISQMLRVPRTPISLGDIVIPNDNEQYKIVQIQTIKEARPYVMDVSLERIDVKYDIKTI